MAEIRTKRVADRAGTDTRARLGVLHAPPSLRRNKLITSKQCVVERRIRLLSLFTGENLMKAIDQR